MRVALTMDADEVYSLAGVASAAIDASVLIEGTVDASTRHNAQQIYDWAMRAGGTLDRVVALGKPGSDQE